MSVSAELKQFVCMYVIGIVYILIYKSIKYIVLLHPESLFTFVIVYMLPGQNLQ